jgi:cytochrome c oxidase subunit III
VSAAAVPIVDVSAIPETPNDDRALVWVGTLCMVVIESTVFALSIVSYLYLRSIADTWPPPTAGAPRLLVPLLNLGVMLVSLLPAIWADQAAKRQDVPAVRKALVLSLVLGALFLVGRVFEFRSLHCQWNSHAYGSVTWTILGLHTLHVVTSLIETAIILAVFLTQKPQRRHFLDARLDGVYWYFVVGSWLVLWTVVFLGPRLLAR